LVISRSSGIRNGTTSCTPRRQTSRHLVEEIVMNTAAFPVRPCNAVAGARLIERLAAFLLATVVTASVLAAIDRGFPALTGVPAVAAAASLPQQFTV
jgi:hypothetical protein